MTNLEQKVLKRASLPTKVARPNIGYNGYQGNYNFHGNADEVFNNFFGTKNPFVDFFATHTESKVASFGSKFGGLHGMASSLNNSKPVQEPPVKFDLALTLEQLFSGCLKKIKVSRKVRLINLGFK